MDIPKTPHDTEVFEHLLLLLGQTPDQSWHHRIIRAHTPEQAHAWWVRQVGAAPAMILIQPELEAALANLVELCHQYDTNGVFGGWFVSSVDPHNVQMIAVACDSIEEASLVLQEQAPAGFELATIVEATPWIVELARMRAISAGQMEPDVSLPAPGAGG